jgi:type IV pilus assembly protein PilE
MKPILKLNHYNQARGFTLIELMIVVVIIAVLAAVAVPTYDNYLVQAHRAEAKAMLERGALWMERNQSGSFSYDKNTSGGNLDANTLRNQGLGFVPENLTINDPDWATKAIYIIRLKPSATEFIIMAEPRGAQANKDIKCKVLVRDHLGRRGIADTVNSTPVYDTPEAKSCWAR